jgi:hypothetical protein
MNGNGSMLRSRLLLTAVVGVAEATHLAWESVHGGVVSHHLLHRPDLPAISNWWGAIVLPALCWWVIARVQRRADSSAARSPKVFGVPAYAFAAFLGALVFGVGLATAFSLGREDVASYFFMAMFPLAVVLPVYRGEYLLGFVLGMTFTFGAVLPTAIGCLFAALSALLRYLARSVGRVVTSFRERRAGTPDHDAGAN